MWSFPRKYYFQPKKFSPPYYSICGNSRPEKLFTWNKIVNKFSPPVGFKIQYQICLTLYRSPRALGLRILVSTDQIIGITWVEETGNIKIWSCRAKSNFPFDSFWKMPRRERLITINSSIVSSFNIYFKIYLLATLNLDLS